MEEEIIEALVFHQHPLRRIPKLSADTNNWCFGCWRYFLPGDAIYGCSRSDCGSPRVFHQECLEMPREIRHHVHPSHTLTLRHDSNVPSKCVVCEWDVSWGVMVYLCSGGCGVWIHMGCAVGFEDDEDEKQPPMEHPSHPQHPLRFSKKTGRCLFPCDACGTSTDKGNSYICSICDYWVHESCASLPESALFPHHPNHSLSLAFRLPYEYIIYEFECAICRTTLRLRSWVYHCQLCRYVVHIKCATDTSLVAPSNSSNNENVVDDEKDIIKGPIADIYEEIIRPFIKRKRGEILIPHEEDGKYEFHNHHHLLNFTRFSTQSSSSSPHDHNDEEEKEEDDDDDDDNNIPRSELTCDGCTLPIHEKKQASSSTSCSYDEYDNGYMSCDECKYFLHLACFNFPLELPSLPLHPVKDHKLTLRYSGKLTDWTYCDICYGYTNGLFYKCTGCWSFQIDIKCASLPNTIKHADHPQHHHYLKLVTDNRRRGFCGACYNILYSENGFYRCDSCNFCMCSGCVLLPAHNKHRLENHRLPLTYDAYRYHSGDFYCGSCEGQMNPKEWMYHCQDCDQSFHTKCFPAMSGQYKNINFGRQQYVITTIHHPNHLLRFQIISKKKHCDLCHQNTYDQPGFQCASCNFVMCLTPCSVKHINDK